MRIIDEEYLAAIRAGESRFWPKVEKTDTCWNWTAGKWASGYGRFFVRGRWMTAHRASYLLSGGIIPEGLVLDHICHNTSCVRPDHLRLATTKQNAENVSGLQSANTSGYTGVFLDRRERVKKKRWRTAIMHEGKRLYLGAYETAEEANAAVLAKRLELFTHNDLDRRTVA